MPESEPLALRDRRVPDQQKMDAVMGVLSDKGHSEFHRERDDAVAASAGRTIMLR